MTQQRRWMLWSAIIVLSFSPISQAEEATHEAHPENSNHASDIPDRANVIEEIVVVGSKKTRLSSSARNLSNTPEIKRSSHVDFQLLPTYDPERVSRNFGLAQADERLRREGIVTLFRFSFGG